MAEYKAQYMATHLTPDDLSFQYGGLQVVVDDIAVERQCLRLTVYATWNGSPIPIRNPLYIYNPPVEVVTGYFWTLDDTNEPMLAHDTKEDPADALKTALIHICFSIAGIREE